MRPRISATLVCSVNPTDVHRSYRESHRKPIGFDRTARTATATPAPHSVTVMLWGDVPVKLSQGEYLEHAKDFKIAQ